MEIQKQSQARHRYIYVIGCHAPDEIFGEWETLSKRVQDWYTTLHPKLPCEGTGNIHLYCDDCPFSEIYDNDADDL